MDEPGLVALGAHEPIGVDLLADRQDGALGEAELLLGHGDMMATCLDGTPAPKRIRTPQCESKHRMPKTGHCGIEQLDW